MHRCTRPAPWCSGHAPVRPFVLVRPDGHVAWRGTAPPTDPGRLADLVRGAGT
ncbi:hypothetical protein [Streptomyces sp. R44]|uniref:Uncharacterized protein n=1 Tax=Streptomyces sp. R44 TaxID=3238633 RepID=A0AB39SU21_9ACTN